MTDACCWPWCLDTPSRDSLCEQHLAAIALGRRKHTAVVHVPRPVVVREPVRLCGECGQEKPRRVA